jgi:hypothetical protein
VFNVVAIFELEDGKIRRDTRYYAEPFEPPEWRAHLAERMESSAPARELPGTPLGRGSQNFPFHALP